MHLSCGLAASPPTECQMESWGLKQPLAPGFRPRCDPSGLYWPQQCFQDTCWCVNPATGEQIPGSMYTNDPAKCGVGSARALATGKAISKSLYELIIVLFLCLGKIVRTKQNASADPSLCKCNFIAASVSAGMMSQVLALPETSD